MPPTAQSALLDLVELHRQRIADGEYDLLGQLDLIHTEAGGTLDFRKRGPLIAKLRDRADLVLASEWPKELPDRERVLEAQCAKCAATCEQCRGAKTSMCQVCGGSGVRAMKEQCPNCAVKMGRWDPDCQTCRGSGEVMESYLCPPCAGTGQAKCPRCAGAGAEGTGKIKGQVCGACRGQGRELAIEPQRIESFVHGKLEGYVALGPIRRLVLHAVDGLAHIDIVDVRPDRQGNLMVALLDYSRRGAVAAYLVGGLAVMRPRAMG